MDSSRKQDNVTLSTTESEYSAMADATKEVMWLYNLFEELEYSLPRATKLYGMTINWIQKKKKSYMETTVGTRYSEESPIS